MPPTVELETPRRPCDQPYGQTEPEIRAIHPERDRLSKRLGTLPSKAGKVIGSLRRTDIYDER